MKIPSIHMLMIKIWFWRLGICKCLFYQRNTHSIASMLIDDEDKSPQELGLGVVNGLLSCIKQSPPQKKKLAQYFFFINTSTLTTVNFIFQEVLLLAHFFDQGVTCFDPTSLSLEKIDGDVQDTGYLQSLHENSWFACVFLAGFGWICMCCVVWRYFIMGLHV